mgnify:CR=1 FL=1
MMRHFDHLDDPIQGTLPEENFDWNLNFAILLLENC